LHRQCLAARERTCGSNAASVGARFGEDRAAALPAPAHRFDACVIHAAQVDKYQTVRFDHNGYSVPRRWAFRSVSVKGYVERVERAIVLCRGRGDPEAAAITAAVERLARDAPPAADALSSLDLPAITVPRPDLSRFDRLLSRSSPGDDEHEPDRCPTAEGQ